jgi:predicted ATPase
MLFVMEDLHWVDPSTLEFLSFLVDQGPTARILALFTFRPDFSPPWTGRSHLTQVTLPRLLRRQVVEMAGRVAHGKTLPAEVMEQVVARTDGVPLFVEELTKMVLESGLLEEREERYELTGPLPPLAIPTTLHDSLMARLDRLTTVKSLAQLAATLGREFSYALLHAVAPWDEATLQRGLHQLVEAEFLYQRGVPPQATYTFKHALIQDVAYQSLLRSTRQQYHQRMAQVLEAQFPQVVETQPELVAHHYTEAGLSELAITYWQQAGERAVQHSAYVEAIGHFTKGLEVLKAIPDTPERARRELHLQTALGPALVVTQGPAAPETEQAYTRAQELCGQVGETSQLFPVLWAFWRFYNNRGEPHRALTLGEQLLSLAHQTHDSALRLEAHHTLWGTLVSSGELVAARAHLEQGISLYDASQHRSHAALYGGHDPGVCCFSHAAWTLWMLGYPDQALRSIHEGLTLARELAHPASLAIALRWMATLQQSRQEKQAAREGAEACAALAGEQGFAPESAQAMILRGWALVERGRGTEEIVQIHQGLAAYRATGSVLRQSYYLALLAEAYGKVGQVEEGLKVLDEALAGVHKTGEDVCKAELYRLKGELLQSRVTSREAEVSTPYSQEAEECFQQALAVAQRQQARSWELRAAMSLSRLWQQGKRQEAYDLLAPIYHWFTEGFDTADLQEAKALLEALV